MANINTLKYYDELIANGIPESQARVQVNTLDTYIDKLATKEDLFVIKEDLKNVKENLKNCATKQDLKTLEKDFKLELKTLEKDFKAEFRVLKKDLKYYFISVILGTIYAPLAIGIIVWWITIK